MQKLMLLQFHFFACIFHFFLPSPPSANKVVFAAHLEEHTMTWPPSLKQYFENSIGVQSLKKGSGKPSQIHKKIHKIYRFCKVKLTWNIGAK